MKDNSATITYRFGVIICPHCRWAKGVELKCKTTKCPQCSKSIPVKNHLVKAKTNETNDLPGLVAQVNTALKKGVAAYHQLVGTTTPKKSTIDLSNLSEKTTNDEIYDAVAALAGTKSSVKDRIELIAKGLTQALGRFSEADFHEVLVLANMDSSRCEEYLKNLLKSDIVYQPRPDRFAYLGND